MPRSKFTTENIVALLQAASEGTSVADVVQRSGTSVKFNSVTGWLSRGRRESRKGETTAHTKFLAAWDQRYRFKHSRNMEERDLAEIHKALEILEEA